MLSLFPRDVLDEIGDLIESVSEDLLPTFIDTAAGGIASSLKCTVKTLNIGTPRPATVVVLNIKQFNFTMK